MNDIKTAKYLKIIEYIKTAIMLLVLLVAILYYTDILNDSITLIVICISVGLDLIIWVIKDISKINPVDNNEVQKAPKKKQRNTFCENIQLAVGLILIAMGVYVGAFNGAFEAVSDVFAPIFVGSTIQTEIIDKVGYPIGASDTYEGVTISVDKIIGDTYNACVIFTVANDDGTPIVLPEGVSGEDLYYGGEYSGTNFPHKEGELHWWSKSERVVESQSEDGALQIIEIFSPEDPLAKGKKVTARFDKLSYLSDDKSVPLLERGIPVLEGKWKLRYELDYEDSSVTIPVDEQFTRDDLTFTVKDITISPIAIQANYKVDAEPQYVESESGLTPEQEKKEGDKFSNMELFVTKKDGTVLDLTNCGYGLNRVTIGTTLVNKRRCFEEIIPLDQIVSVTVGDVVVPIN